MTSEFFGASGIVAVVCAILWLYRRDVIAWERRRIEDEAAARSWRDVVHAPPAVVPPSAPKPVTDLWTGQEVGKPAPDLWTGITPAAPTIRHFKPVSVEFRGGSFSTPCFRDDFREEKPEKRITCRYCRRHQRPADDGQCRGCGASLPATNDPPENLLASSPPPRRVQLKRRSVWNDIDFSNSDPLDALLNQRYVSDASRADQ